MTQLLNPADDFDPSTVTLDRAEFDALHLHLTKIHEILEHIFSRHTGDVTGVALAAKACAEADLRGLERDVDLSDKYLSRRVDG